VTLSTLVRSRQDSPDSSEATVPPYPGVADVLDLPLPLGRAYGLSHILFARRRAANVREAIYAADWRWQNFELSPNLGDGMGQAAAP
jgi:hypothetical protein